MPHAGGTLGKYVVHNFICLCFMVEGSYVIIYTQDHNSSPERGRLRITLCRHQEDMKELLPIHHHHHLQHRVRSIICMELHSPIECCLNFFFCDLLGGLKTTTRPPSTTLHGCLLRLPRTMIPSCIHLWLCYAVLPET